MDFREHPFQRLSDKSLEGSQRFGIAVLKVAKWCLWVRFEHSLESRSGPFRNYQTVSPDTCVNTTCASLRPPRASPALPPTRVRSLLSLSMHPPPPRSA